MDPRDSSEVSGYHFKSSGEVDKSPTAVILDKAMSKGSQHKSCLLTVWDESG